MMSQKNRPCWRSQCIYVMHDDNLGTDRLNLIDLKNIRWTVDDDKDDKVQHCPLKGWIFIFKMISQVILALIKESNESLNLQDQN